MRFFPFEGRSLVLLGFAFVSLLFFFFVPKRISRSCRTAKWLHHNGRKVETRASDCAFRISVFYIAPVIDSPDFRCDPTRDAGDNATEIILVTRHATCRCNFAAISNFLAWLASSPRVFFRSRQERTRSGIGRHRIVEVGQRVREREKERRTRIERGGRAY